VAETAVRSGGLLSWSSVVQDFLHPGYGRCTNNPVPHHSHLVVPLFSPLHLERRSPAFREGKDCSSPSTHLTAVENSSPTGSVSSRLCFGKRLVQRQKQCWHNTAVFRATCKQAEDLCWPYSEMLVA